MWVAEGGRDEVLATPVGDASVGVFGPDDGHVVIALHGKSPKLDVVTEWAVVARALAAASFRVIVPNLHANPRTAPAAASHADVAAVLLAVLDHYSPGRQAPLLGK
jgi:acetyl esterase/lipase